MQETKRISLTDSLKIIGLVVLACYICRLWPLVIFFVGYGIVIILRSVEFFDGSTWENGQYGTLYSKYEQQLLAAGDENILPRG